MKVKEWLQGRRGVGVALFFILLLGAFLRLYHFGDWLHFELDQARDARVIVAATEGGIGNLPLLGPRAGGTFLRLGPGFYYLQYLSAFVFGSTPWGMAMIMPLLSIASVGLLFLFFRRYFDEKLALGLTLLSAVSLFLIVYARFAWNPNPLPFFLILGFYALLRAVDREERQKGKWFLVATAALAFATHLHFVAFVSLPAIVLVFLVVRRPVFHWRVWAGAVALVILFYFPVVLNDIATGGANVQEFLEAVQGKSNKENHTLAEQVVRNVTNQAVGFWTLVTGYEYAELVGVAQLPEMHFDIKCDYDCRNHLVAGGMALLLFTVGGLLLVYSWWKEEVHRKKDFLLLSILWYGACFALFIPLSYDFSPRFFLLVAPFPFLFLGLVLHWLKKWSDRPRLATRLTWFVVAGLTASNLFFVTERFDGMRRAPLENFETAPDRILKEKTRITLEQQEQVVAYMGSFQKQTGYAIYMFSEPEHRRALKYLMERAGLQNDVLGFSGGIYEKGHYFLIYRSGSNHENKLRKYIEKYDVIDKKSFGTLTVFQLVPKPEALTGVAQDFSKPEAKGPSTAPERFTWKEWWARQAAVDEEEENADEELIGD
jgi:4-amino-4-deoxy-L-arabinose transferase-like glycosyltransferase